jgi:hypothetical protein
MISLSLFNSDRWTFYWWSETLSLLKTTNNALTFWFWFWTNSCAFEMKAKAKNYLDRILNLYVYLLLPIHSRTRISIHSFVCLFCIWLSLIIRMNVLFSPQKAFIVIPFINSSKYGSTLINFLQVQFYFDRHICLT